MQRLEKKWIIDSTTVHSIEDDTTLEVPPFILKLLHARGIHGKERVKQFLYPEKYQPFYDPFLLKDMEFAVERIKKAILAKEKIVVYGDYDVDGITASSLLTKNLKILGANVEIYIPERLTEGYGLHEESLKKLAQNGTNLVITVDCGISSVKEVRQIKGKLDIIITDHHLPGENLPAALAVIDPHRKDCPYPFKDLAGVGVAFKLVQALYQKILHENFIDDLDLVALGTVADIVTLLDENRKIVKLGLRMMENTQNIGMKALLDVSEVNFPLSTGDIGFKLAPRLNAVGRLQSAQKGVDLLLAHDVYLAQKLAEELNLENENRRKLEQEILQEAEIIARKLQEENKAGFVISGKAWHSGVIGIVASRIVEKFYRPTVIISVENGIGKGSCRSIEGFNIYEALSACKEYLEVFGGHEMAAGLTVKEKNIKQFFEMFSHYAEEHIAKDDYLPKIHLASKLEIGDIDLALVYSLKLLEPYGQKNPKPLFYVREVEGRSIRIVGKEQNHMIFMAYKDASYKKVVAWNLASEKDKLRTNVDLAFSPEINEYRGEKNIQLRLIDIKVSDVKTFCPTREELSILYQILRKRQSAWKKNNKHKGMFFSVEELAKATNSTAEILQIGIKIFQEIGLLEGNEEEGYILVIPRNKLNLFDSPTYAAGNK